MTDMRIQENPLDIMNAGEIILQQYLYAPFSLLLNSMDPQGYLADQKWTCGLPIKLDDKVTECSCLPNAASTYSPECLSCSSGRWKSNPTKKDKLLPWVSIPVT